MAASPGALPDSVFQELADGFDLLRQEYLGLAIRHQRLQSTLQATKEQYDKLASMLPEQAESAKPTACPFQYNPDEPVPTIEDMFADVRVCDTRDRDHVIRCYRKANAAHSLFAERKAKIRIQPPIIEEPGTQDFTTNPPGPNARAACPFAGMNESKFPGVEKKEDDIEPLHSLGKITSNPLADPIEAKSQRGKHPITPAESTASGPVCPIRFMDKHSPEEVAAYFEEHKSELPRSHEICIKRFQTNAESIRQLDEKYGSLVTMIQGLGQKHKPMLPDNPDADGDEVPADLADEAKMNEKIEAWTKAVSSSGGDGPENEELDSKAVNVGDAADDQRVGYFDRPLKDIRVGESPSRPWGVPIPSKYLDRENDDAGSASSAPKQVEETTAAPQPPSQEQVALPVRTDGARPTGKCPFDHAALAAMTGRPNGEPQQNPSAGEPRPAGEPLEQPSPPNLERTGQVNENVDVAESSITQVPEPDAPAPEPSAPVPVAVQEPTPDPQPSQANGLGDSMVASVTNYGIAIVAPSQVWKAGKIVNHGTLFLAGGSKQAGAQLERTLALHRQRRSDDPG